MACACQGGATTKKYIYTAPNGAQTTYTSEVQARAAQIRNSGGTYTTVPA